MHTKYCPHCGSTNIHKVREKIDVTRITDLGVLPTYRFEHYHECEDCHETWSHYEVKN